MTKEWKEEFYNNFCVKLNNKEVIRDDIEPEQILKYIRTLLAEQATKHAKIVEKLSAAITLSILNDKSRRKCIDQAKNKILGGRNETIWNYNPPAVEEE